jgi:type IV fimbrial biogenesis protein FimT
MVSVLVFAVLVGLAVPSFRELMFKSRLRGATDDIVNLLNFSRGSAVKLQRDVNFSIDTSNWCAGAIAASDPTAGSSVAAVAACDCTASTVACKVGGQNALVSSGSYSGVTISTTAANTVLTSKGGVTFNSKFGALGLGSLPTNPIVSVYVDNKRYSTQISLSQLGQVYVCTPNTSQFVSGYPSC